MASRAVIVLVLVAMSVAMIIWSLVPSHYIPEALRALRYFLHPLAYGLLVLVSLVAAVWDPWTGPQRWADAAPAVVGVTLAAGLLLEGAQFFTTRGPNIADAFGNVIGVSVGAGIWWSTRALTAAR